MSFEGPDRHAAGYRREIDGMRAVAVLAVMLYHARIPGFGGGYAGVGDRLRGLMDALSHAGKRVILVYPIPDVGWNVPLSRFKRGRLGRAPSTPLSRYRERQQLAWRLLDSLGSPPGLERLYPSAQLCGGATPGRCRTMDGDTLYYIDDNHLSPAGARLVLAPLVGRSDLASPPRATAR